MHNNATKTWKKDIKNHKNACMNKEREEKKIEAWLKFEIIVFFEMGNQALSKLPFALGKKVRLI